MEHQRKLIATTSKEFTELLSRLHTRREDAKSARKAQRLKRGILTARERELVLAKTDGRCHICGGNIEGSWHADHVLAHSIGGSHRVDNYLPAHALCNNYRWDYSAEEFQLILKLGVWCRNQIEKHSVIGREVAHYFLKYEAARIKRRKSKE
ncbi:MAG: HNH endonuclease [Thermodesulfobacteriota bacterium]